MRWLVGHGWAPPGRSEHGPGRRRTPHCRRGKRGNARVAPTCKGRSSSTQARHSCPRRSTTSGGASTGTSTKQAIAIRLSEARRADVKLGVEWRAAASSKESARRDAARAGKTPLGRRAPRGAVRAQARGTACHVASCARTAGEARRPPPMHRRARRAAQKAVRTQRAADRRAPAGSRPGPAGRRT